MSGFRNTLRPSIVRGAISFCALLLAANAGAQTNPCNVSSTDVGDAAQEAWMATPAAQPLPTITTSGLTPVGSGQIIYDSNANVCWLANANLAGNPIARQILGVPGINPDGTMDYATAWLWVEALNHYNKGAGYLGHQWQLPNNPIDDKTCSQFNIGNFGVSCTHSALGKLYSVGLGLSYPESVIPNFAGAVYPFHNLQSDLYWTSNKGANKGETTFSFNTGLNGSNTPIYNLFYVLPLTRAAIGTPPVGTGLPPYVLPYTTGPAAGKAVFDTITGYSWIINGNLAATDDFGVSGSNTITSKINGITYVIPWIDGAGAMLFSASALWIQGMNDSEGGDGYAGSNKWVLPHRADYAALNADMGLMPGSVALEAHGPVGPFLNLQPGFYWACARDPGGNTQSPCDPNLYPVPDYIYSFNFNEGFEGTDKLNKKFYVMVNYPAN